MSSITQVTKLLLLILDMYSEFARYESTTIASHSRSEAKSTVKALSCSSHRSDIVNSHTSNPKRFILLIASERLHVRKIEFTSSVSRAFANDIHLCKCPNPTVGFASTLKSIRVKMLANRTNQLKSLCILNSYNRPPMTCDSAQRLW